MILVTLLVQCVITNRVCVSRQKNTENFLKQNYENALENDLNNKDDAGYQRHNDIKFEKCENYCYTLWKENKTGNGTEITIIMQGCWKQSGYQECGTKECVAFEQSTKALNNTKFCCCQEDYCNINITDHDQNKIIQPISTTTDYSELTNSKKWILVTVAIFSCTLIIICSVSVIICKLYQKKRSLRFRNSLPYCDQYSDSSAFSTGTYTFDNLKLATIVGQGRYGSVWKGSIGDQDVAVKIFPAHYRHYFQNEKDTYCLPFMEHSSLLKYYGADERINLEGNIEYFLVLSFSAGGTLVDFLRSHTVDWLMFCKMSLSIVKGLAYLHTDHHKNGKIKPCIAHRDMNSRNILIKADGTCCICDLGLAVQISGSKYFVNGEEQHAETKSINDVGTLRYMAPEVLEGAVNLRDCESSLKQIDIYAVGLVLWEIVSRCSDIYVSGSEIPSYKLPFEKEIGLHPTFEQMQILVSRNKARPLLEGNLVDKSGVRLIKETMEDCWDADAEARLTALCIEERLIELQSHRVTVYFTDGSPLMNSNCGLVPSTTNSLYNETHHPNTHNAFQDENVDVNLVALSPIDNITYEHCKNSNEMVLCSHSQTLQPYQGRNPCMERNLMVQSNSMEQLACNGNILIDKSSKHSSSDQYRFTAETQVLIPHDYLAQNTSQVIQMRPATPIPYVQNVISENGAAPSYNKLKQTNVYESCVQESPRKKGFAGWSTFKNLLSNSKLYSHSKCQIDREDSKSNLLMKQKVQSKVETNVTISSRGKYVNEISSPSASFLDKNDRNVTYDKNKGDKIQVGNQKCSNDNASPCTRPSTLPLVPLRNKKSENNLTKQNSINKFNQVFNVGSSVNILKDPNMRIKTPGDLPPSVRKVRGRSSQTTARFSLYDDRIMCNIFNEEDNQSDKTMSNSVPYGMDLDCDSKTIPPKLHAKDITCF